jgi:hypothetical protein
MELRRVLACLAIAVACVFAGFVARQPDETASYENCKSIKKFAEIIGPTGKHYPADYPTYYADEAGCNPPKWYATLKRPEWLQIIVAAIGIGIIAWQSFATARSAKAAEDGVVLMINKERAWLTVDLDGFDPTPQNGILSSNVQNKYLWNHSSIHRRCTMLGVYHAPKTSD